MLARTILMRGITAVGIVVLARILAPEDFGAYAVFVLIQNVLMFVADFGIGASLVQQEREPSREQMATAWVIQQLLWVLFAGIIWFGAPTIAERLPALGGDFEQQLKVLSLSAAFTLIRALPSAMLARALRFREVATIEVAAHLVFYSTAIVLAVQGAGAWSFVVGLALQTATAAVLANLAWRKWPGIHFRLDEARRLLRFGFAFQASNLANALRDAVVPLFGGLGGGVMAIGFLQFTLRVSQLTASVDEIIARVTFPLFSRIKGDAPRTARVLADAVVLVCILIGPPQAWIISTAPTLVPVVFGNQWTGAVPALQLMSVGVLAMVPARVLGSLIFGQGNARVGMINTFAGVALLFALFGPLVLLLGPTGGGLAYAMAGCGTLFLQSRAIRPEAMFPWASFMRIYVLSGIAGLTSWYVVAQAPGVVGLVVSAVVFGLVNLALLGLFARRELAQASRIIGVSPSAVRLLRLG